MFDAAVAPSRKVTSTPDRLVRFLVAIGALAVVAAAGSLWAARDIGEAARTIGRDAEPSVALALRMTATLADMDAATIDESLVDNGATIGTSLRFRAGLDDLAADGVEASRNITYGEAEAGPLREFGRMLDRYAEAVVEARLIGPGNAWLTSRRVQWASRLNRAFVTPAALALAQANADELERRYAAYRASSLVQGGAAIVGFALLVAALLTTQIFLARKTRRLLNPLLVGATLVTVASGVWFGVDVLTERADLRAAKADAYDSLHVLFEAKSEANALRAAASLWLLDPTARADAQARIVDVTTDLIGTGFAQTDAARALATGLSRALALERRGDAGGATAATPHPGGLLGTELVNITFGVPEREAATDAVSALAACEAAIVAARTLDQRDRHTDAVVAWLRAAPGGGAATFAALQAALDRTIAVNQGQFDRRVTAALDGAARMPVVSLGGLALAVVLAVGGVWPRLREYR